MRISLIVAKAENNAIGLNNKLPWHLKDDLQNFKKLTMGHHMLMGRKTFESIGKALPGRMSLVVSSEPKANQDSVFWFTSIFRAIKQAERNGETELFIIGGEKIYKYALSLVDRIYLTEVKGEVKGDVFFPQLSLKNWKKISEQSFSKNTENDHDFTFQVLDRR
ncbi:dihydrofolate reductase [Peredibacter starrii]|uniref:Dihydrofolate reductase n=1 Tax=Peredibacter starrii TaxID=28202 RepID=A0AAX4HK31_9BACT|nr:dihydrofolate reductase [Peredibacter starrii]WPU63598.1 dihydrofolate reductase [Peredibacter starrii]